MKAIKYIVAGILFGIIMTKSEAVSWYRIQEMFRYQDDPRDYGSTYNAIHEYGLKTKHLLNPIPGNGLRFRHNDPEEYARYNIFNCLHACLIKNQGKK